MTRIKKIMVQVSGAVLMVGLALNFSACAEQASFAPGNRKDLSVTLNKNPNRGADSIDLLETDNTVGTTKEQGSMVSRYDKKWDKYRGGKIILSQGSCNSTYPTVHLHLR